MTSKPKFPLCEKYGLIFQGLGNGDWIYIDYYCGLDLKDMEKIELALSKAEEQGKLEGIAEERDRAIRWLWNEDNAICTEFKRQFPRLKSQLKNEKVKG